jgi:hypothetical protein
MEHQYWAKDLIRIAENGDKYAKEWVIRHPRCPEAVKLWVKLGEYAGLTLTEFLEKIDKETK